MSRKIVLAAILLAAAFSAYAPSVGGKFIWDDHKNIIENPCIDGLAGLGCVWVPEKTPQYYPLTYTVFWLEKRLWGLDPVGYHLVNILLHACVAFSFFQLLGTLGLPGAGWAALLFAVHPVHVESVAWITELKNLLSALFYLAALGAYLRFEEEERRFWYWTALALFLAALLSKTAVLTLPAALLILRWWRGRPIGRRELILMAPFLALGAVLGWVTVQVETGAMVGAFGPEFELTPAQRAVLAGKALWFYARTLAWPSRLCFVYERWAVDPGRVGPWAGLLSALALAALLWSLRRRIGRGPAAAAAFYAATLVPVLGFFDFYFQRYSYVADHLQYLASLGPLALAACGAAALAPKRAGLLLAAAAGFLWLGTWRRAHVFADSETIWQDTARTNGRAFLALSNLGGIRSEQGRLAEGEDLQRRALALKPDLFGARYNLAWTLLSEGKIDAAVEGFRDCLRARPGDPGVINSLGFALLRQGRGAQAEERFREAIRLDPRGAQAYNNLGTALAGRGRREEALFYHRRAVDLDPSCAVCRENLRRLERSAPGSGGAGVSK